MYYLIGFLVVWAAAGFLAGYLLVLIYLELSSLCRSLFILAACYRYGAVKQKYKGRPISAIIKVIKDRRDFQYARQFRIKKGEDSYAMLLIRFDRFLPSAKVH